MLRLTRWVLGAFVALWGFSPVFAATVSTSMGVSAQVVPGCTTLSTTALNFGTVPSGNLKRDANSTISVTCSEGVPFNVTIDNGLCHPFLATQRKMGLGGSCSATLDYEIYLDAAHTQRWHDGGFLSGTVRLDSVGTGGVQPFTAFGEVSPSSSTLTGAYSDTVVVFLNF